MKRYKLSTLLKVCFIIASSLAFIIACEKTDVVDTNQMGGGAVTLISFGPSPIQRGAELRIIGTNLDKVTSVVLQGPVEIKGDDIKRISATEIRVMVPQNAEPGVITIKTGDKEITSTTPLTFDEPIIISTITPETIKAGGVIKIEGDYLNRIEEIIFFDDVHVLKADFKSQTREAIEVVVPKEAQTGKIIVSNGADIIPDAAGNFGIPLWVYSDDELNVTLPKITKISPNPIKAGAVLTIEGTDFDLTDSLVFKGNVGIKNFAAKTATQIQVIVPETAQEGAVKLIAFSGVEVESDSLMLVAPKIISVDPNPVKNGATLTIKGTDLDLVSSVVFGGDKEGTIEAGGTAAQIQVTVPMDATDGVTLKTLSGKEVPFATLKMIVPKVTAFSPASVPAGSDITFTGTDLDLVVSVTFPSGLVVPVKPTKATELTVTVPTTAVSGTVVLTLTNGTTVECPNVSIISPVFAYLPTPPEADAEIHAGELLVADVENGSKLTDVQVNGVSTNFILNNTKLYILIPSRAAGKCELKLISSNGEVAYTIPVIGAGIIETVAWEDMVVLSGWNNVSIPNANFGDAKAGDIVRFYMSDLGSAGSQLQVFYGDWGALVPEDNPYYDGSSYKFPADTKYFELTLTADMVQKMLNPSWGNAAFVIQGDGGIVLYKISLITKGAPPETVLWSGNVGPIEWNANENTLVGPVDMSLVSAGQTLGVDFVVDSGGGQIEAYAGSWWTYLDGWLALNGGDRYIKDCAASETNIEFTITQADIDNIIQEGSTLFFAGGGIYITRVYVK